MLPALLDAAERKGKEKPCALIRNALGWSVMVPDRAFRKSFEYSMGGQRDVLTYRAIFGQFRAIVADAGPYSAALTRFCRIWAELGRS